MKTGRCQQWIGQIYKGGEKLSWPRDEDGSAKKGPGYSALVGQGGTKQRGRSKNIITGIGETVLEREQSAQDEQGERASYNSKEK